jgi:hypothetical protein
MKNEKEVRRWFWINLMAMFIMALCSITMAHILFRLLNRYPHHYAAFKIEQSSAQHVWQHVCNGREQSPQVMGAFVRCSDALATTLQWTHSVAIERTLKEWSDSSWFWCSANDGPCRYVLYKTLDYFASSYLNLVCVIALVVVALGWMALRTRDQYCMLEFLHRMQTQHPSHSQMSSLLSPVTDKIIKVQKQD